MALTAVDISPQALALYVKNNPGAADVRHASILSLPFPDCTFDGVYNLGVMEHFDTATVGTILSEFRRVLRPGGKAILFWPHARGTSVAVLGAVHYVLNDLLRRRVRLHPPEVSLLASRSHAEDLLRRAGLEPVGYSFGPLDGFVQAIVVGRRAG
jgi:SAM-dependent methyltransferase